MAPPNIDLRHLRYFVAVAEHGSISRAAKRLHISQPPLSRQMRDLEAEVAVSLFGRDSRRLMLTSAGEVFLREAKALLERFDDTVALTRQTAKNHGRSIRVGHSSVSSLEALPRILRCFQELSPNARVELRRLSTSDMIRGLRRGELDICLTVCGSSTELADFSVEQLSTYGILGAFARQHPLTRMEEVPLAEIAQQPVITLKRSEFTWYNTYITDLLVAHNSRFQVTEEHDAIECVIAAVEAGRGVALIYDVMAHSLSKRIALRPLTPLPPKAPLVVFYPTERRSSLTNSFLKASQVLKRYPALDGGVGELSQEQDVSRSE
ncbi:Transcriptional regulator [Acidisarcina polymorpha]|uniref:Transcriptional regulator n=1 Tax=Acidisarcina polymorpha TaxID=2211140 RepID=A0A2Z5FT54_9BACT|nr:LysR substrate-binding domain-containing protein [Acidisarcina polymorpha]AXC10003.1 Transcriptional regulator [Acidisarcina polymorpha]